MPPIAKKKPRTPAPPALKTTAPAVVTVARVPDKSFATKYIHRTIRGVHDFDLFDMARETARNILMVGPTGAAKTTALLAYAAERDLPFYAIPSNVAIEPSQMFGKPWNRNGVWEWIDGGATAIARHGGVLVINEGNFLPDRIATVLFSLLDDRREITLLDHEGETVRAHRPMNLRTGATCWCNLPLDECKKRWVLIALDMNEGYEGTRPLNKAFRNRFAIQLDWDYDTAAEKKLVASPALLALAKNIRAEIGAGKYDTPVSTNMLMEFEQFASDVGIDFAIGNFVSHFATDERPSIDAVFRTAKENLKKDIPLMKGKPAAPPPPPPPVTPAVDAPAVAPSTGYPFDYLDWRPR